MGNMTVDLKRADFIAALLLLAFGLAGTYVTTTWLLPNLPGDPGAAFFPRIAIFIIIVFSLILLIQTYITRKISTKRSPETITIDLFKLFITVLTSGLLVAGIDYIGFEIASFLFLFLMLYYRTNRVFWSFFTGAVTIIALYFIFVIILKVRLPLLFFPNYIGF